MFDGFDDLENRLESQERDAESIVEQEQNAETREQQLEAAVSQLERDAAVSAKLQANREQTQEEVERVAETKRECSARLTDVRQSLSELQKEVNAEEAVIAELREMGEDVSESEGILQDRKEWLRACWEKAETVAEILGLDIGELNFESTEGGDGSYGGDSGAEKQDEELESDNEENNADHSMNKKEDRTHMSWGDKIKSFFGFRKLKYPSGKEQSAISGIDQHSSESTGKSNIVRESFSEKLKSEYYPSIELKIAAANSISELLNIIKTEQLARNCYLGDLDLPTAKALVQTIYSSIKESGLQDIIGAMPVIGITSAAFSEIRKELGKEFQRIYQERYPNKPISTFSEDIQYQVNDYMDYMTKKFGILEDTLAISVSYDIHTDYDISKEKILQGGNVTKVVGDSMVSKSFNGILLNATDRTSLEELKEKLLQWEANGDSPKECNTFKYLVIHELVHQADHILKVSSDPEVINYYRKFSEYEIEKQKELLCLYGADNINEFVAEAYAEAICSAHPREIALYIKQKFDTVAENYRKKSDDYIQEKER